MMSQFTLKCQEKASECLKYGKTIWRPGLCPEPRWGSLEHYFSQLAFYSKFSVDLSSPLTFMITFNYVFGSCLVTTAYQIRLIYSVANYDRKHLENSKIGLENSWNCFHPKDRVPAHP